VLAKNPNATRHLLLLGKASYSGHGELHQFLSILGWKESDFADFCGIHRSAFSRWRGHPLAKWPVELLRLLIWSNRMAEKLSSLGYKPEEWSPKPLPPMPTGRYVRTAAQAEELLKRATQPEMIECKIHGWQRALGGECPRC
jgi:hypothetical protein